MALPDQHTVAFITYFYIVNPYDWQNNRTAPLWLRVIAAISAGGVLFYLFHTVILVIYIDTIEPQPWIQEIYFNLIVWLPAFLLITGRIITIRSLRIPLWIFLAVFTGGYVANFLNAYEVIDISGLQWPTGIALVGLFITYLIDFIRRKKNYFDFLKLAWFISIGWPFIAKRFVPHGGYAGWFIIAAQCLFPVIMIIGLILFYTNKKHNK